MTLLTLFGQPAPWDLLPVFAFVAAVTAYWAAMGRMLGFMLFPREGAAGGAWSFLLSPVSAAVADLPLALFVFRSPLAPASLLLPITACFALTILCGTTFDRERLMETGLGRTRRRRVWLPVALLRRNAAAIAAGLLLALAPAAIATTVSTSAHWHSWSDVRAVSVASARPTLRLPTLKLDPSDPPAANGVTVAAAALAGIVAMLALMLALVIVSFSAFFLLGVPALLGLIGASAAWGIQLGFGGADAAAAVAGRRGRHRAARPGAEHRRSAADLLVPGLRLGPPARPAARGLVRLLVAVPRPRPAGVRPVRDRGVPASRRRVGGSQKGYAERFARGPVSACMRGALVGLLLLLSACGQAPSPVALATPSAPATAGSSPSPASSPSPTSRPTPTPPGTLLFAVLEAKIPGSPNTWNTVAIAGLDGYARAKTTFIPMPSPDLGCMGSILPASAHVAAGRVYFADGNGVVRSLFDHRAGHHRGDFLDDLEAANVVIRCEPRWNPAAGRGLDRAGQTQPRLQRPPGRWLCAGRLLGDGRWSAARFSTTRTFRRGLQTSWRSPVGTPSVRSEPIRRSGRARAADPGQRLALPFESMPSLARSIGQLADPSSCLVWNSVQTGAFVCTLDPVPTPSDPYGPVSQPVSIRSAVGARGMALHCDQRERGVFSLPGAG